MVAWYIEQDITKNRIVTWSVLVKSYFKSDDNKCAWLKCYNTLIYIKHDRINNTDYYKLSFLDRDLSAKISLDMLVNMLMLWK